MTCKRCNDTGVDRANYDPDLGWSKCTQCGKHGSFHDLSGDVDAALMQQQEEQDREYQRELRERNKKVS